MVCWGAGVQPRGAGMPGLWSAGDRAGQAAGPVQKSVVKVPALEHACEGMEPRCSGCARVASGWLSGKWLRSWLVYMWSARNQALNVHGFFLVLLWLVVLCSERVCLFQA